ncbi:hypothetical protein AAW30_01852 [Arcobacter porcinus]|nr:hypothetical protein AAW30_01852 [Arcobacter porcinus]
MIEYILSAIMLTDAVLVTNNVREFERVKELKIEDWCQKG